MKCITSQRFTGQSEICDCCGEETDDWYSIELDHLSPFNVCLMCMFDLKSEIDSILLEIIKPFINQQQTKP